MTCLVLCIPCPINRRWQWRHDCTEQVMSAAYVLASQHAARSLFKCAKDSEEVLQSSHRVPRFPHGPVMKVCAPMSVPAYREVCDKQVFFTSKYCPISPTIFPTPAMEMDESDFVWRRYYFSGVSQILLPHQSPGGAVGGSRAAGRKSLESCLSYMLAARESSLPPCELSPILT